MLTALEKKDPRIRPRLRVRLLVLTAALAFLVLAFTSFIASSHAAAQEQKRTETKDTGGQATIKATVRQVLLDVVVTNGKNHPVTGLQQDDFSITEDGNPQRILFFEAHTASADAATPKQPEMPAPPASTFRNTSPVRDDLPLNVLLYDLLNTPLTDQPFAHNEVVKFLQNRPSGCRFAIFVLSDSLHLLQGFTDDEELLVAAMNRKGAGPFSSPFFQGSQGTQGNLAAFSGDAIAQSMLGSLQNMEAQSRRYFMERRVEHTIGAFVEIGRFLSGLPGRKNLIWLSGSFPANLFPGTDPFDPFGAPANFGPGLRQASDLLTLGQVAVYPVDIRGLTTDPFFDASNIIENPSPENFRRAHLNFILEIAAEQDTMDQVADDTGGHAFYNTNGLSQAIATSTEDGSNYYTLSYAPTNTKFDGRLRKIHVQLSQRHYHLAYRHSYLADENVVKQNADLAPTVLEVALRRGAPLVKELSLQVHVTPQGKPKAATKEEIAQLADFQASKFRKKGDIPKIQRYSIDYALDGSQIALEDDEDGGHYARFEIVFGAYDAESRLMFGYRSPREETYPVKNVDKIRREPFRMRHVVEVPSDTAWLRLAVRDVIGDHVGSVEIPLPLASERARPGSR